MMVSSSQGRRGFLRRVCTDAAARVCETKGVESRSGWFVKCSIHSLLTHRPLQFKDSGFPATRSQLNGFFVPYRRGGNMSLCGVELDYDRHATGAQVTAVTHDRLLTNLTNSSFLGR